jgi:hypothetical protein
MATYATTCKEQAAPPETISNTLHMLLLPITARLPLPSAIASHVCLNAKCRVCQTEQALLGC